MRNWLKDIGTKALFIEIGSTWKNGYGECFNGKFRNELLNREEVYKLKEAQVVIGCWRQGYN